MLARIAGIKSESVTDGPGLRCLVFFQGCPHHCPGCHNPHTWALNAGTEMDTTAILDQLRISPLIQGITLSGGEPFLQPGPAREISKAFHRAHKDVWAYTGYLWEDLLSNPDPEIQSFLAACDVLVDGPFQQELHDPSLQWRGSANQRIINVQASFAQKKIVLWEGWA
jgi:anaerobic ribonucleoside-triphosphate reductase activating protein